jgi:hypothetical protein
MYKDVGIVTLPRGRTETPTVDPLYAGRDRDISLGGSVLGSTTPAYKYMDCPGTPQKKKCYGTRVSENSKMQ